MLCLELFYIPLKARIEFVFCIPFLLLANSAPHFLQEVHIPRLITPAEKGRDLEPRVIDAYIIQCQAEAQEGKKKKVTCAHDV